VVRLAGPPEGVASRAFISTTFGGKARATAPFGTRLLIANFTFAALPARGEPITVGWLYVGRPRYQDKAVPPKRKTRARRIVAFLDSEAAKHPPGLYRAELRAGHTLVATARIRVR
jgi:hypothetical protein